MNKKIIITQRPDLISERVVSNHITRLPLSRQKQISKPVQAWHTHNSGIFSTRNRLQLQNKPTFQHQRYQSSTSDRPQKDSCSFSTNNNSSSIDLLHLVGLVSQLAKLNTQTQQRLTQITSRLTRLEQSLSDFKSSCPQSLTQQVQKSLDQLYATINSDFKNSEESIIRHVAEIRDEVREVTSGRLEEIERAQQREVDRRVEEMRREMVLGMDRVRDELRREVERVKDGIDGWKKKVAAEVNRISLDQCVVNRNSKSRASMVRFMCTAKTDKSVYPVTIHEYCYYISPQGYLTDQHGYYIMDSRGQHISLSLQHLLKLRQAGLLFQ